MNMFDKYFSGTLLTLVYICADLTGTVVPLMTLTGETSTRVDAITIDMTVIDTL